MIDLQFKFDLRFFFFAAVVAPMYKIRVCTEWGEWLDSHDRMLVRQCEVFNCMRKRLHIDNVFLRQHIASFLWSYVELRLL